MFLYLSVPPFLDSFIHFLHILAPELRVTGVADYNFSIVW